MIVLSTSADKIDGLATRSSVLDIFAAVEESALVLLRPDIVQLGHEFLARTTFFNLGDVDKK